MSEAAFFDRLRKHYDRGLPFVAYRLPNESEGKAFLQANQEIFFTEDLSEAGFIFAPFEGEPVLIPEDISEKFRFKIVPEESDQDFGISELSPRETSEDEKQRHLALVRKALLELKSGRLQKVVLSRKEEVELHKPDPLLLFQELLISYPTAFVYLWSHPKKGLWLGATPETLLKMSGQNFTTMALAGTQKFSGNTEIEWGKKEHQEQQFVTDEILRAITPLVDKLEISEVHTSKAGNLLHLKTDISGRINSGREGKHQITLKNLVRALHPTPAVCGLPKQQAKDFILKEEHYKREFYTGFLGEINLQKSRARSRSRRNVENLAYRSVKTESALFVNLRCMKISGHGAELFMGGGITADSSPEAEWKETVNKAQTMKKVLLK